VIIGYSQVLKKRRDETNPLREYAEEIEKAGQRAGSLTRQLLAFSRQQVLAPAVLDLNALLTDLGKMLPRLIGEDIELALQLDPRIGRVKADQSQIEQVVMNPVVNARDALPQGGRLVIGTKIVNLNHAYTLHHHESKVAPYVTLSVTDNGTGMNLETLAHLFEPFLTTKERGKGTDLGLATVYGVVKHSGGYIWVDSELGKGSSFKVYLPQIDEPVSVPAPATLPAESFRGEETVLLVDDADALRKLAHALLEQNGYCVLAAENGEAALKIAEQKRERIHLLLTDVIMPGMTGRALADRLVASQSDLKALYMFGYTDSAIADQGVLEPGTYLLHKPFSEQTLIQKVREVLDAETPGHSAPKEAEVLAGSEPRKTRKGEIRTCGDC
jgi:CheY-like chemotaxis protein